MSEKIRPPHSGRYGPALDVIAQAIDVHDRLSGCVPRTEVSDMLRADTDARLREAYAVLVQVQQEPARFFTWEDVDLLGELADVRADDFNVDGSGDPTTLPDDLRARVHALADRIAALLPSRVP